ncbi:MAG TPA: hypothetical protein VGC32_06545 [Solirubrobacterales bacterium]
MRFVGSDGRGAVAKALGVSVLVALMAMLVAGSAAAAGNKKLVEGTLYDVTCGTFCEPACPPPPHCGPITAEGTNSAIVCPLRATLIIACPLAGSPATGAAAQACLPDTPCGEDGTFPIYTGEGATVNIRKRGSTTVLATLPVIEGHFKIRLGPGAYVFHPFLPEPQCLSTIGTAFPFEVSARRKGPITAPISVVDSCVAHPGSAR